MHKPWGNTAEEMRDCSAVKINVEQGKSLENQIAIVTGASSGIGRAIAVDLARQGAEVCLVSRRPEALEVVAQEILVQGCRARVCCADLTVDEDIHNLAARIASDFGRADILVLCGGVIFHGTVEHASLAHFDQQYRANMRGHYGLVHAILPFLAEHQGQVVFVNSSIATRPSTGGTGQFAATQHALRAIADSFRDEVSGNGIRVLSVYPGRTATPRTAALFERDGKIYSPELLLQPEDVAGVVTHALCLPRRAEVTDISIRPMAKWG